MIVKAVASRIPVLRQRWDAGIFVVLAAADHLAVPIVRPDADHVIGQFQIAAAVQFHHFAIQIGTANGLGISLLYKVILFPDQGGQQRTARFGGIVLRVIRPERSVALSAEADVPDHAQVLLLVDPFLPERAEQVRVLAEFGFQVRVALYKQGCAQRFGVVVGQDQPHVRRGLPVLEPLGAGAGNDHVAATAQKGLKGHAERLLGAAVYFPVRKQGLVVDEPSPIPHPGGGAGIVEAAGNFDFRAGRKCLVVPEPEGLNAQKAAADLEQAVDEAQNIGSGKRQDICIRIQTEAFRGQGRITAQTELSAGGVGGAQGPGHIAPQGVQGICQGLFGRFLWQTCIVIEFHIIFPL